MEIIVKTENDPVRRLAQLEEGDVFVRWANPRDLKNACAYLVLHQHLRLAPFCKKSTDVPVVNLRNGRVQSLDIAQPVLLLKGTPVLEINE